MRAKPHCVTPDRTIWAPDGTCKGLAAQAGAPIHQVAALLRGEGQMWAAQSDEALLAQGRASAQGADVFAQRGLPMLTGLREKFAEGARMLDVGTGVAAMAVAYAELFPRLTVVGIDVMPRVLAMAEETVAALHVRRAGWLNAVAYGSWMLKRALAAGAGRL